MAGYEEHEMSHNRSDLDTENARPDSSDTEQDKQHEAGPDASQLLQQKVHWGLPRSQETILFYTFALLAWIFQICAAALGPYRRSSSHPYIATVTLFCVFHWAAWGQTAFAMMQRASWRREETVVERVQFLFFAVRLQRLMIPTAFIAFCTFIQAYARRHDLHDPAYWILFLLFFLVDIVFSVMNAYNNIVWEADRLWFEDNIQGVPKAYVAILGI